MLTYTVEDWSNLKCITEKTTKTKQWTNVGNNDNLITFVSVL